VLVVEDDPAMREMICRMLSNKDWTVSEARNGLARAGKHPPAVSLVDHLDLKMPVMDGFQMVAELHKHRRLAARFRSL